MNSIFDSSPRRPYRVLLTSDLHLTDIDRDYFGTTSDERLQAWANNVLAEHEKHPFDLIVIAGDVSLDYWGWNGGGSFQRTPSQCDTARFMEKYASQLPKGVPVIVLPGNHELYSDRKWRELTGNGRSASFVLGKNLILMPDTYGGITEPSYEGNGKNDNPYTPVDMDFISQEMKNHPDCDAVYLISHHFQLSREFEGFREFLKTEKRIVGLFSGHTHGSAVKDLGEEFSGLTLAQTGSFVAAGAQDAAHFNWGFRELLIRADGTAESRYIVPANEFYAEGQRHTSAYKLTDGVTYPTR